MSEFSMSESSFARFLEAAGLALALEVVVFFGFAAAGFLATALVF
jgi:hypothetical protein